VLSRLGNDLGLNFLTQRLRALLLPRKTGFFKWLGRLATMLSAGEKQKHFTDLGVAQNECAHSMR